MLQPGGARRLLVGVVLGIALGAAGSIVTPLGGEPAVMAHVVALRSPVLTTWAHLVTTLGDLWLVVLAALVIAVVVRGSSDSRRIRTLLLASIGGSVVIVTALKLLVARPRPADAVLTTVTSAYPSGHAMRAVAVHGLIVWACHRYVRHPVRRVVGIVLGVLLVAAITLSRLYLGVHLPSELVAGALLGGLWLAVVLSSVRLQPPPGEDRG